MFDAIRNFRKKMNLNESIINVNRIDLEYTDIEKISLFGKDIALGIKNYILHQKFSYFKWPFWIYNSLNRASKSFTPIYPILLFNTNNRNCITLSNPISSEKIKIDPSGMVSSSCNEWSIEFWICRNSRLFRSQERLRKVSQVRDIESFIVNTVWKERDFDLIERIYLAKTDSDEAIIELECDYKKNESANLFVAIRPYNLLSIGGIESVEYERGSKILKVNNNNSILVDKEPDIVLFGNGNLGDIELDRGGENRYKGKCGYTMATLALGYNLHNGNNELKIRFNMSNEKQIDVSQVNFQKLKKNYIDYTNLRMRKGFNLKFPDERFRNWFYATKVSALNFHGNAGLKATEWRVDYMKYFYYITSSYNRMGYLSESLKIIDSTLNNFTFNEKASFAEIIDGCYFINSIADYFSLSRNIDYLKSKYNLIKNIALTLYNRSLRVFDRKGGNKEERNSIYNYVILEHHIYDVILLSFSLYQFSYLARCIGIFGDELKFNKESERLESIILNELSRDYIKESSDSDSDENEDNGANEKTGNLNDENEFFCYKIFAGFPFRVRSMNIETLDAIIERIFKHFQDILYIKSQGGKDVFLTIIFALNLLLIKDFRMYDILTDIFKLGGERYTLPDIINPGSGLGISGEGDSNLVKSAFFVLLRSILFIDFEDRLDIFPIPREEWFSAGSEIIIEGAPSRFGNINFRVISTKEEIQFRFNELPKYLPPDILINLPFNVRIKQEEDFLIKKETGNSFLINGWPSIVRFLRQ